jgi:prepilin-type N-terminal cleavage/methylation domain-containing protein
MQSRQSGFTLLELMIVLFITLIIAGLVVPNIRLTVANYRLSAAGHSVAGLMQQARIQAVKTNQPAYITVDVTQGPDAAYIASDPAAARTTANPQVVVPSNIQFQNGGLPDHSQLDNYLGAPGAAIEVATAVGFSPRGLPCLQSGAACLQQDPAKGGAPPAFEWFMQSTVNQGWEAVTVTPSGRIKTWRLGQLDATSTACGFPACWQ